MAEATLPNGASAEVPRQDGGSAAPPLPGHDLNHHATEAPSAYTATNSSQYEQAPTAAPAFNSQINMTYQHSAGPFNMGQMAHALPNGHYQPQPYGQGPQRYAPAGVYGTPPAPHYYLPQMPQYYQASLAPQPPSNLAPRPDMGYYPSQVMVSQPAHSGTQYYYASTASFPGQPSHAQGPAGMGQYALVNSHQTQGTGSMVPRSAGQNPISTAPISQTNGHQTNGRQMNGLQTNGAPTGQSTVVRGPPRKPRHTGHAIWIGNLPPQADLMSLVHHVCEQTQGLDSLFLIAKSNCAFANYRDEELCSEAQRKLHDSTFMTVRLVSRLRKNTVEGPAGVTAPTGPAASAPQATAAVNEEARTSGGESQNAVANGGSNGVAAASSPSVAGSSASSAAPQLNGGSLQKGDRFFVLKSLTIEDLEQSVQTGIWATQSHNEERLNSAFESSENVYLVFSANKSGEYFGYARMVSPINEDPAAAIEFAPSTQLATEVDLPKIIPTEPTECVPKGRIIDDSPRGSIFWEADREDIAGSDGGHDDEVSSDSVGGDAGSVRSGQNGSVSEPRAWGKPFQLEWLSTTRLPFYRTRGLRNPWNSNREVKIARDGTELEPSVGRRLIGCFNQAAQNPAGMLPPMMAPMAGVGMPGPSTAGYYPHQR